MRRIFLGIVCLLTTSVFANGFTPASPGTETSSLKKPVTLFKKNKKKPVTENSGTTGLYHVTKMKGTEDKYILVIGKMADTKVRLDIYDKEGRQVYGTTRKAGKDLARVIVLKKVDGASFVFSDNKGLSKTYTFND
jgi:hypothetical protein